MCRTDEEIRRVEAALKKTESPYLKRDYEKYLKKLKRQKRCENASGKTA